MEELEIEVFSLTDFMKEIEQLMKNAEFSEKEIYKSLKVIRHLIKVVEKFKSQLWQRSLKNVGNGKGHTPPDLEKALYKIICRLEHSSLLWSPNPVITSVGSYYDRFNYKLYWVCLFNKAHFCFGERVLNVYFSFKVNDNWVIFEL